MIKNIATGGIIPDKRMTVYKGQPVEIKRTYKIVDSQPVIVWDIVEEYKNFLILKFNISENTFTLPSFSRISSGYTIDWGDGKSEKIEAPADVVHIYENIGIYTVTLKYNLESNVSIRDTLALNQNLIYVDMSKSKLNLYKGCFFQCTNLQKIKLIDGLKSIPEDSFCLCENLVEIENIENIITLGNYSFLRCTNLKTFDFPNLQKIGGGAFGYCLNLEEFDFSNITSIGSTAFEYTNLKGVIHYPENLYAFENCFIGCKNITEVFALGVSYICTGAFNQCENLKIFHFSNKLKTIEIDGFKLPPDNIIYFHGTPSEWNSISKHERWNINGSEPNVIYVY